MEIQPSLLSYIFAGSTKWCINYEFPELTLELDGAIVKLNPEQVLEAYIRKGWMWSTVTLKTQDQNYLFKGLFNAQAEKLQTEIYNDAEFLKTKEMLNRLKQHCSPIYSNTKTSFNKTVIYPIILRNYSKQILLKDQKMKLIDSTD